MKFSVTFKKKVHGFCSKFSFMRGIQCMFIFLRNEVSKVTLAIFVMKCLLISLFISVILCLGILSNYQIVFDQTKFMLIVLYFLVFLFIFLILNFGLYLLSGVPPRFFLFFFYFISLILNHLLFILIKFFFKNQKEDVIRLFDCIEFKRQWTEEEVQILIGEVKKELFLYDISFVNDTIKVVLDGYFTQKLAGIEESPSIPLLWKVLYFFENRRPWLIEIRAFYESLSGRYIAKILDVEKSNEFFLSKIQNISLKNREEVIQKVLELKYEYIEYCVSETLNEVYALPINPLLTRSFLGSHQDFINLATKIKNIFYAEFSELPGNLVTFIPIVLYSSIIAASISVTVAFIIPGIKWVVFDKWFNHGLNFSEAGYWQKFGYVKEYICLWPKYQFPTNRLLIRDILGPSNFKQYFNHYWWTYGILAKHTIKPFDHLIARYFQFSEGEFRPWPPRELIYFFQHMQKDPNTGELDLLVAINNYFRYHTNPNLPEFQEPQEMAILHTFEFRKFFWIGVAAV